MKDLFHTIAHIVWPTISIRPPQRPVEEVIGKARDAIQVSQSFRREVRRHIQDKKFMEGILGMKDNDV